MAPIKRGSRRIDAALDAMRPYGFPVSLVRETVKELLDVYGGDEGWIFVEEASYTLLIETILEKQRDVVLKEGHEIDEALPIEGPSHLNEVSYSVTEAADIPLLTHKVSDALTQTTDRGGDFEAPQSKILDTQSTLRSGRRKPYYGWIAIDGEEEDLVDLSPAYSDEELNKLFHLSSKQKRQKI